jgi:hypothetical protein
MAMLIPLGYAVALDKKLGFRCRRGKNRVLTDLDVAKVLIRRDLGAVA